MKDADLDNKLATARDLYRRGNYQDPVFHELAAASYQPAKALFLEMLNDPRLDVRYSTLHDLVGMDGIEGDEQVLNRIREIVVRDPDELSRSTAAVLLGSNSRWPDVALERALATETSPAIRQTIFLAILELMVSWDFADEMHGAVRSGQVELSLESALALASSKTGKKRKARASAKASPGTKKKAKSSRRKRGGSRK